MSFSISFEEHIRSNNHNFKLLTDNFPKTTLAASYINDIFDQIYSDRYMHNNDILWQYCTAQMIFGIHYCWINYFIQTAMGYNDIGLMSGRKAVEYTCYISKIRNRNGIAQLWQEKTINTKKAKRFSNTFSIPKCYFNDKYSHLIPLLVIYNFSSEYGVHGNHASLASKFRGSDFRNKISMSFQDEKTRIPQSCGVAIQTGSFIIDALLSDLKEQTRDYEEFKNNLSYKKTMVRDALLEVIQFTDHKPATYDIVEAINMEDMSEIMKLYEELKSNFQF